MAWKNGHIAGIASNRWVADQAQKALAEEREAHHATNAMLTGIIADLEERLERQSKNQTAL